MCIYMCIYSYMYVNMYIYMDGSPNGYWRKTLGSGRFSWFSGVLVLFWSVEVGETIVDLAVGELHRLKGKTMTSVGRSV